MARVTAQAPSNIALIKYMGKDDDAKNLPANGSISLTLDSLRTVAEVSVKPFPHPSAVWIPEPPEATRQGAMRLQARVPDLSDSGVARMLRHVERVRREAPALLEAAGIAFSDPGQARFEIRAANTFPASAGIASSASSFAAVTVSVSAAITRDRGAFRRAFKSDARFKRALASLSRHGSGSSCRSFDGPWVLWEKEDVAPLSTRMPALADFVLLVGSGPKSVPSSDAHSRVKTSPLWEGRTERVAERISLLEAALGEGNLVEVSRIAWSEMWEMHSLFHTCAEPFTYWEPGSIEALQGLGVWIRSDRPPVVTMDAGANVHVIVPQSDRDEWRRRLQERFPGWTILEDVEGHGAELLGETA